jgi:hypothetical protein
LRQWLFVFIAQFAGKNLFLTRQLLMTRSLTIVALILVFGAIVFAQTADPANLKINGVGLDSTYAQVIKALGKPLRDGRPVREECVGGHEKTVEYSGLKLYFMDEGGKTFKMDSFTVTSPKWLVSGVRVGDTPAVVKSRFGTKYTVARRTDNGGLAWHYDIADETGTTTVIFKNGKVTEISSAFLMC